MSGPAVRFDVSAVPFQGGYIAKRCPVVAQNDILQPCERREPSPAAARRMAAGRTFEQEIFATLASVAGAVVIDRSKPRDERADDTLTAMDARASLVIGGRLPADPDSRRVGEPDVLVRVPSGYIPIDVKHHRTLNARSENAPPAVCSDLTSSTLDQSAADASWTRRLHRDDLLQLAHYCRMLEAIGRSGSSQAGIIGVERRVVWHDLAEPVLRTRSTSDPKRKTKVRSPLDVYDFEFGFRLDIMAVAALHQQQDDIELLVVPAKLPECDDCEWWTACGPVLETWPGDVTTLPRVGWEQRRLHVAAGVFNRLDLARLDPFTAGLISAGVDVNRLLDLATAARPDDRVADLMRRTPAQATKLAAAGIHTAADIDRLDQATARYPTGTTSLPEQIDQARAALGPAPVYRRRGTDTIDVPRGDVEVDVDMENSDEGVYLWGALVTDRTGSNLAPVGYHPFVTWLPWTLVDEQALLVDFWAWLSGLHRSVEAAGASFRAYCYSEAAENSRLRNASIGTDLEHEVEAFIASNEWVDLRPIVEKNIITGAGCGLKKVAPLTGFAWASDDAGGDHSMVLHDIAIGNADETPDARAWLLRYNEDDCQATLAVREWLQRDVSALNSIADVGASALSR